MTVKEVVSFQVGLKKRKKEARGNGRWYEVKEEESIYPSFNRSLQALAVPSSA